MSQERSANAVDREIGARVRERRLESGMSQERLAELLGITFQQVQKYEKGVNRIAASRLKAIAAALDTPVMLFYEGLADGVRHDDSNGANGRENDAGMLELIALFGTIKSAKVRRRVIEMVRAIADEN